MTQNPGHVPFSGTKIIEGDLCSSLRSESYHYKLCHGTGNMADFKAIEQDGCACNSGSFPAVAHDAGPDTAPTLRRRPHTMMKSSSFGTSVAFHGGCYPYPTSWMTGFWGQISAGAVGVA